MVICVRLPFGTFGVRLDLAVAQVERRAIKERMEPDPAYLARKSSFCENVKVTEENLADIPP